MKAIVVNKCYGGFGLSREAFLELRKMGNKFALAELDIGEPYPGSSEVRDDWGDRNSFLDRMSRDDPDLVAVVRNLGEKANNLFSKLGIVEIPDEVDWTIEEYDGIEYVAESHRTW